MKWAMGRLSPAVERSTRASRSSLRAEGYLQELTAAAFFDRLAQKEAAFYTELKSEMCHRALKLGRLGQQVRDDA
jgi:hypothetical protein